METDSDSTNLYLFFQRMAFKTDLIAFTAGQSLGLPDILDGPTMDEELGRTCEVFIDCCKIVFHADFVNT
jgi:dynactin 1